MLTGSVLLYPFGMDIFLCIFNRQDFNIAMEFLCEKCAAWEGKKKGGWKMKKKAAHHRNNDNNDNDDSNNYYYIARA